MITSTVEATPQTLTLPEELILMLLNEESGYFHQVPGWDLNCAIVGAVLGELSLLSRIDTDLESLFLIDATETGDPALDPILKEIAGEPVKHDTLYWVERLAHYAESIIDFTLDKLADEKILEKHEGEFWTLARNAQTGKFSGGFSDGTLVEFVKTRISKEILDDEIPDPRDAMLISLINACDVFRFMFQLEEETEQRIEFICRTAVLGRTIAAAVAENIASPLLTRSALTKKIPRASMLKMLFNKHTRNGNFAALFADLAREYGPVFQINPPFQEPMIFLAGPETNHWVHRRGRMYLRAKDYIADFEKVYGANGVLPSLDGADHFKLRKSLSPAYSRARLSGQLEQVYQYVRQFMSTWKEGDVYPATDLCRRMTNAQLSPLFISVESQDLIEDLAKYKERALLVHVMKVLPRFMLKTPNMRKRAKAVETLLSRVQNVHTPSQRAGQPRDLADDLLSLHSSDPQLVSESDLRFALSAALIASVYLGDALSFGMYAMAAQPEIYAKIQEEADALFENGDPVGNDFTLDAIDVTHRFIIECLRMYPIVPVSMRTIMNSCVVEDYELPVGSRIVIAQAASHFMEDVFPEPFKFDIDRYKPPRNEHLSPGYAPYGLGTHTCLGSRWMDLQLTVNLLMVAHYFDLEISPSDYKMKFNPLPSTKPSKNLNFRVVKRRRDIPL